MASLRDDNEIKLATYPQRMEQWREQVCYLRGIRDASVPPITTDLSAIEAVIAYYDVTEERLAKVAEAKPVVFKIETEAAVTNLIELAVLAERERILKILAGPHGDSSGLDSWTLGQMIEAISPTVNPKRSWTAADRAAHTVMSMAAPLACKCGDAAHDESDERPATIWVS